MLLSRIGVEFTLHKLFWLMTLKQSSLMGV